MKRGLATKKVTKKTVDRSQRSGWVKVEGVEGNETERMGTRA